MIFTCGDTHGEIDFHKLDFIGFPEGKKLTKEDYVIIAGDWGAVWGNDERDLWLQKWYEEKPWTTLVIDGNHENFDTLLSFPEVEMFGDKVGKINDSIYHLKRGKVYLIDGLKIFTFGGGYSLDKEWRKEGTSWWSQEMPSQADYNRGIDNLDEHDWEVDYVITHSCPKTVFESFCNEFDMAHKIEGEDTIREYLDLISKRLIFKKWFFGHFHIDHVIYDKFYAMYNNPPIELN